MDQVSTSRSIRNRHERYFVLVDPLPERNNILCNYIGTIAVARNFVCEHNFAISVDYRNCSHLWANRIDNENTMTVYRTLQK